MGEDAHNPLRKRQGVSRHSDRPGLPGSRYRHRSPPAARTALCNNSANMRHLKNACPQFRTPSKTKPRKSSSLSGVRLVNNVEANRQQIFFPEIPSELIRRELNRNGFHWSPTARAWQGPQATAAAFRSKMSVGSTLHAISSPKAPIRMWRLRPFRACAHRIPECRRLLSSLPD